MAVQLIKLELKDTINKQSKIQQTTNLNQRN